jgi:hypothetical protein
MSTLQEIEKAALQLTPREREALASHLLQSIHQKDLTPIDLAWLEVAEKEYQEYLKDPSSAVPYTDHFFDDLRSELGWK